MTCNRSSTLVHDAERRRRGPRAALDAAAPATSTSSPRARSLDGLIDTLHPQVKANEICNTVAKTGPLLQGRQFVAWLAYQGTGPADFPDPEGEGRRYLRLDRRWSPPPLRSGCWRTDSSRRSPSTSSHASWPRPRRCGPARSGAARARARVLRELELRERYGLRDDRARWRDEHRVVPVGPRSVQSCATSTASRCHDVGVVRRHVPLLVVLVTACRLYGDENEDAPPSAPSSVLDGGDTCLLWTQSLSIGCPAGRRRRSRELGSGRRRLSDGSPSTPLRLLTSTSSSRARRPRRRSRSISRSSKADKFCNVLALRQSLFEGRKFAAWLSSTISAKTRIVDKAIGIGMSASTTWSCLPTRAGWRATVSRTDHADGDRHVPQHRLRLDGHRHRAPSPPRRVTAGPPPMAHFGMAAALRGHERHVDPVRPAAVRRGLLPLCFEVP